MKIPQSLPWIHPLTLAQAVDEPYWVLLYSGARTRHSGRYSYLACNMAERIEVSDFSTLASRLSHDEEPFSNAWFGYLGYGLKHCTETLKHDAGNWITLPDLCMMRFETIYIFDHDEQCVFLYGKPISGHVPGGGISSAVPAVAQLRSNMSRAQYLEKAACIIERIRAGDLYQANLTRKFIGSFAQSPDAFSVFKALCAASPSPYSAFLRLGGVSVVSSSPEQFLKADASGEITTRPIKGTAARFPDPARDLASRNWLANDAKNRAENLMIVDLMRNDFSKTCLPNSIHCENLFEVTTHATIHHMASTIIGRKRPECSTLEAIEHCFPPGSMTGAPKIRAMNLCSELEIVARGIYSGAIGWLGGDGSAELSVVIRTLILHGAEFEFQVGSGLVSDSLPEQEFQELLDKSRGILTALNIAAERLSGL